MTTEDRIDRLERTLRRLIDALMADPGTKINYGAVISEWESQPSKHVEPCDEDNEWIHY